MANRKSDEKYIRGLKRKLWESQGREAKLVQALKVATDAFEASCEDHFSCVPIPKGTPKSWKLDPDDYEVVEWKVLVEKLRAVHEEVKLEQSRSGCG